MHWLGYMFTHRLCWRSWGNRSLNLILNRSRTRSRVRSSRPHQILRVIVPTVGTCDRHQERRLIRVTVPDADPGSILVCVWREDLEWQCDGSACLRFQQPRDAFQMGAMFGWESDGAIYRMGRVVVKVEVATAGTIPMELGHLVRDTFISSVVGHLANELGIVERSSSSYNVKHSVYDCMYSKSGWPWTQAYLLSTSTCACRILLQFKLSQTLSHPRPLPAS